MWVDFIGMDVQKDIVDIAAPVLWFQIRFPNKFSCSDLHVKA